MLRDPILQALRPLTLREHLRVRLAGGWSAVQVRARIAPAAAEAWLGGREGPAIVLERALVEAIRQELLSLAATGNVRRSTSGYGVELRSKGHRHAIVDVFRLS